MKPDPRTELARYLETIALSPYSIGQITRLVYEIVAEESKMYRECAEQWMNAALQATREK